LGKKRGEREREEKPAGVEKDVAVGKCILNLVETLYTPY
jgi:hypothetical protein